MTEKVRYALLEKNAAENPQNVLPRRARPNIICTQFNDSSEEESQAEITEFVIFNLPVQAIYSCKKEGAELFYLVKYPHTSPKKLVWESEAFLAKARGANKSKLMRFKKVWAEAGLPDGEIIGFDENTCTIDRIVMCSDMFSIIHPKKAQESAQKFTDLLVRVMLSLINFEDNGICYGVHFLHIENFLVDESAEKNEYLDFSVLLNLLYTDHFTDSNTFWVQLGRFLQWVQRKFEAHPDLLRLGRIFNSVARHLYDEWHVLAQKNFEELVRIKKRF